ncbi:chromosome partitioning protein ParB [Candidatus Symbiopectobacterium sp. NZEC135]|uniref:chromosome partitioning protein ParB n=1 Tax=Candidatus Symbiopectobacterium sp. NZEC135 TaxID=2820471 RepID=UPI002225B856|nr:chromosome partitioning protein ParB [Candidatus Symbiopectobacterium sp. NZEC135]MCW2482990.1 chromosome partitioning protein ParB [Candidatus Symbiopectobacterium sp. NZEC135]
MINGPLISSQRYLDRAKVVDKAYRFNRFYVEVYPVVLRGKQYTLIMDGHHSYAAAKLAGIEPTYRPIRKKLAKIFKGMTQREIEVLLINNITDSHLYYVESGEVVEELAMPEVRG